MNTISEKTNNIEEININSSEIFRTSTSLGICATIDVMVLLLQKINSDMRDIQRDHYASQQSTAFKKELTAIATKQAAIELNYKATLSNAIAKTTSGVISVAGAGLGIARGASLGGEFISSGTSGLGRLTEGSVSAGMANTTRDAQKKQALGDFQSSSATEYYKSLSNIADSGAEASKRMANLTRELNELRDRIFSAVRF